MPWRAIKPEPLGLSCLPDDSFACPLDKTGQVHVTSGPQSPERNRPWVGVFGGDACDSGRAHTRLVHSF